MEALRSENTLQPHEPLPLSSHAKPVDSFPRADALEKELKRTLRGEVRFDPGSRALFACDASNYRQIPIGLVVPRDAEDVIRAVALCREFGAPVLPRGAGTSLAGQSCNVAVVLDFTKYMHRILELDPERKFARVEPGVVLDAVRSRAETHHLTFAPDPSTHNRCTIGGMIGNNSCGTHSLLGGKTVDNVEELRILLYDGTEMTVGATGDLELEMLIRNGGRRGEIYAKLKSIRDRYADEIRARFPRIPRRVSGYNLDELLPESGFHVARALVGTEGTCAVVLEARVKLIHSPPHRTLVGFGYEDAYHAADHVPEILEFHPIGLEGLEGSMIDALIRKGTSNMELMPEGRGYLLVEFGSDDPGESQQVARKLVERLKRVSHPPTARIYTKGEARAVWQIREAGPRAAAAAPGAPPQWDGWDDSAVAPEKLGAYLRDLRKLLDEYQYVGPFYGHFGHGCVHLRVSFDLQSEHGLRKYTEFVERAADLVVSYGGSLSGEHGDGQSRAALLPRMFGPELMKAFREFKSAWDPANGMNPHKVVDAYDPVENLRLGVDFKPAQPLTHFTFPDDHGSFAEATQRCIGVGACRKSDAGTMCPSYMVTREEKHSTRGRAHMLFELLQGEVVRDGWKDSGIKDSLELCLSCKACKSECPANVDLATYKAEFLSHYYESHRRPLAAHAFGKMDRWLHLAAPAPWLANILSHTPGPAQVLRWALHLAPEREIPRLAPTSFRRSFRRHGAPKLTAKKTLIECAPTATQREAILWVDTFNNSFHPRTLQAAHELLVRAGCRVTVPLQPLCCGRPLYDFGMLDEAREYLRRILEALGPQIDSGVPVVVLEPSCASVFRDELCNLLPREPRAERLKKQTLLLSEFLTQHTTGIERLRLERKVLLQGHCHQQSVMKMKDEESVLRQIGADLVTLDAGCCGMAGPFGFDREKYAVSQAIGERVLLPAVREVTPETLIVADGFSCREQIYHATGRRAIHLAEALELAAGQQRS
jgi:FAD/FMN-containing dehydrogenase/Fe-S oxidoreductase